MALSDSQKAELKEKLYRKLVENTAISPTWSAIAALSSADRDKIATSLVTGEDVKQLILKLLQQYATVSVATEIETILSQDTVAIDLLYRVMK